MLTLLCLPGCRKYEWIVKGGEETRIDQRIEQLFDIMNGLMQRQPGAASHNLRVRLPTLSTLIPKLSDLVAACLCAGCL